MLFVTPSNLVHRLSDPDVDDLRGNWSGYGKYDAELREPSYPN